MEGRHRSAARRRVLLIAACWLLEMAFLRFAWIAARPEPGQWALTYFGRCAGGPGLVQGYEVSEATPPVDVDREGLVGLAPGQSLALPLAPGAAYTVRGAAEGLAPYLVLVADVRGPPPAPAERAGSTVCSTDPRVPFLADGELGWSPWRAAAPWREDAERLRSLARACGAGEGLVDGRARREGDELVLAIGSCTFRRALAPGAALAVVAGPHAVRIDRAGGWSVRRRIAPGALLTAAVLGALHAAALIAALGAAPSLMLLGVEVGFGALAARVQAVIAGLAVLPSLLVWLLLGAGACLATTFRLTRPLRTTRARGAAVVLAHAAVAAALVAAPLGVPALARAAIGGAPVVDRAEAPARCLLVGYSTAAGSAVAPHGADALATLDARCAACAHAIARRAMPGHIFEDVAAALERPDGPPLARGGTVLFWGGGNDDIFWPMLSRRRAGGALVLLAYVVEGMLRSTESGSLSHPTVLEVQRALDRAADASAGFAAEQASAIGAAARAVRARGDRFVYAHDFLAYDVGGGRSPARRLLVARRRAAVLAEGGVFVDLLEDLGPEIGVAWFDDFIHPSAWGHEQIAARLCRAAAEP
jgi:hypothetical protein